MMLKLEGEPAKVSVIDQHSYICDLINVDGPLLSLYRDNRSSWLYLWADTNGYDTNRWLVFNVSREGLVDYFKKASPLKDLVDGAKVLYCMDIAATAGFGDGKKGPSTRRYLTRVSSNQIVSYMPTEDSYFDESLTDDISLNQEVAPSRFAVPIDGNWFLPDLDKFSRGYTRLYAFFYCTKPRFVTNIGEKLSRYLHSPWQGGYSRINMFDALHKLIPSVHDTKVASFQYASPGNVTIEALGSVGLSIRNVVLAYLENYDHIKHAMGAIDGTLSLSRMKKKNLSSMSDAELILAGNGLNTIRTNTELLGALLNIQAELASVTSHSPNSVVTAKATMALLTQIGRIAEYQRGGMLDLTRDENGPLVGLRAS